MTRARRDPLRVSHAEVITADEVAALLRMTPDWIYSETRRNRIPHMRLGRYVRYRRSAIEAWMEALEAEADTARSSPSHATEAKVDRELPDPQKPVVALPRREHGTRGMH
jgi:excisionase family DNA binding protein